MKVLLRQRLVLAVATAAACYLFIVLLMTGCQGKLLYFPSRYAAGTMDKVAAGHGLRPWVNADGERIGWQRAEIESNASVLVIHGNAGSALDRLDFVDGLRSASPVSVYVLEYPGYGQRSGTPSQKSILRAAEEALALLTNSGPVYVLGESLGTGAAAYLAGTYSNAVGGLLLICPYNNMTDVAKHHMSLLPVGLILRDRYPSDEWLRRYSGPLGVLVAANDTVVPARFGRLLYQAYAGPKKLWEIPNAGHNDVHRQTTEWWAEVFAFWGVEK